MSTGWRKKQIMMEQPAVSEQHKQSTTCGEPVTCVYKATTKKGETAHFGEYSAAKAWAGWGTVEQVPLKTLTLIQKSIQPCQTCEALARTVMLDQTSHDTAPPQRTWVGLTDEEIIIMSRYDLEYAALIGEVQRKLKEKNGYA